MTSRDRSVLSLVQNLEKFIDPLERIFNRFTGIDYAIAIPLQGPRFEFA